MQKVEQPFAIKKKSMQLTRYTPWCVPRSRISLLRCHTIAPAGLREGSKPVVLTEEPRHGTFTPYSPGWCQPNAVMQCTKLQLQHSLAQLPPFEPTHNNVCQCVTKIFGGLYFPQDSGRPLCPGLGTVIPPATPCVMGAPPYLCNLDT